MDNDEFYKTLLEILSLLYVLKAALDNDAQPTTDTTPYACFIKLIKHKIADLTESIQL